MKEEALLLRRPLFALCAVALAAPAAAAEISTHVLDLARGIGAPNIAVVLMRKEGEARWTPVGSGRTDANGRIRAFGDPARFAPGIYKLHFDMAAYPTQAAEPFFPEIDLVFRVSAADGHYHVPIAVSPFGYSTYRGN